MSDDGSHFRLRNEFFRSDGVRTEDFETLKSSVK
jgi:hypothetical protein